jgi:hypothetical protein
MGRPRCDPFDAKALSKAIDAGEVTSLRAYAAYASVAARPYARASWEKFISQSRHLPAQSKSKEPVPIEDYDERQIIGKNYRRLNLRMC